MLTRKLLGFAVIGIVATVALASAASLGFIAPVVAQAGNDTDLTCDNEFSVKIDSDFDFGDQRFEVDEVVIGGINSACAGTNMLIKVQLTGTGSAANLATMCVNVPNDSDKFISVPGNVVTEDVLDVHVLIQNGQC